MRDLRPDDIDDFFEYAKNPNVNSELSGWEPHFADKEKAAAFLKTYAENNDTWAIVLRNGGKVIGHVKIYPDENRGKYSERNSAKLITYALSEDYWGRGYMTEAVKRAVKYVFDETGVELLTAFHVPHNVRSKRVIEKCSFQYETTIEQGFKHYDGKVYDSVVYSIMKFDYCERLGEK
jgi:RimJ/RimL family protein N-acetyltransferase